MTKGRLTRQELSWLLTQEAQNAAERLRSGVQVLRTHAPPPPAPPPEVVAATGDPSMHVDASLDALDDVMRMLSNLNQRSSSAASPPRRGRIDLASLLVEIAPEARVSIEPGSGTEVFGDEADFRRMLQVMLGHASGEGQAATVRRDGDDVRIAVSLGPDASPTAETERAWLSRMALRYGGRYELEGGTEVLVFPAEGAVDKSEREALRRELDEARKQGEVYARELAAVFERGEEVASVSSVPPPPGVQPATRFATVTKMCAGIASELRATLGPVSRELVGLRRHDVTDEQLDGMRRRVQNAKEMLASLASIGNLDAEEFAVEVDLVDAARAALRDSAAVAERGGVNVALQTKGEGRAYVRAGTKAVSALIRELVMHAVAASPRGGTVDVAVLADANGAGGAGGPGFVVDDAGQPLPASARRAFLALETHAGAYGRPTGLPIFMAAELAACQGAVLELSDSPLGGLRVTVRFSAR